VVEGGAYFQDLQALDNVRKALCCSADSSESLDEVNARPLILHNRLHDALQRAEGARALCGRQRRHVQKRRLRRTVHPRRLVLRRR
jgi:hypothetical protein